MNPSPRIVLTATFPVSGAVTTLLGPLLPALIAHWSLTDAAAGQFFPAQFLLSTAGAAGSGALAGRFGAARTIGGAYAGMGIALLTLGFVPHWGGLVCVACYGAAAGASIPLVNWLATRSAPGREVAQLNLLNMAWCLGAVLTPPLLAVLFRTLSLGAITGLVGLVCLLAGGACFAWLDPAAGAPRPDREVKGGGSGLRQAAVVTSIFVFLYIGVESSLNGWLATWARRVTGSGGALAAAALSLFWASILLSRLVASATAHRLRAGVWILSGLSLAIGGIALLLGGNGALLLLAGSAAAGFGLGPIFPTTIAIFQNRKGGVSARTMGLVFAVSGCGGAVAPWLVGVISSASGSLRLGMLVPLAAALVMALLLKRLASGEQGAEKGGQTALPAIGSD